MAPKPLVGNPVVKALKEGESLFHPQKPNTIAKSIAIGNPADGYYVMDCVRKTGGSGASPTDEKIIDAIKLLAQTEGIFTEPAGGTTLAAAIELIESGEIPKDESICVCITGNGLKTIEVMQGQFESAPVINAKMKEFSEVVDAIEAKAGKEGKGTDVQSSEADKLEEASV